MNGRRFRLLTAVDDCTYECQGILAGFSVGGLRVTGLLDQFCEVDGQPAGTVTYNGTEFTSMAMFRWAQERGVQLCFIDSDWNSPVAAYLLRYDTSLGQDARNEINRSN